MALENLVLSDFENIAQTCFISEHLKLFPMEKRTMAVGQGRGILCGKQGKMRENFQEEFLRQERKGLES